MRVDTHVYSGAVVPPFYDSMLAKIIVTGRTRESAIARMERALSETRIEGVKTTIDFCREIMRNDRVSRRRVSASIGCRVTSPSASRMRR